MMLKQLISFLKSELDIPDESINLANASGIQDPNLLPIVLWQYGLLSLKQLELVFDWLEMVY